MNHHPDPQKIQNSRENGYLDDVKIGRVRKGRDQKSRGAHDRRHELSAGRCRRFDRGGHMRTITGFFHHGNGIRSGGHGVRGRRTGDRTDKAAGDHCHLGRTAPGPTGQGQCDFADGLAGPGGLKKGGENYERKNKGGIGVGHDTVDPAHATGQKFDDATKGVAVMSQNPGDIGSKIGVQQKKRRQGNQHVTDDPSGDFK